MTYFAGKVNSVRRWSPLIHISLVASILGGLGLIWHTQSGITFATDGASVACPTTLRGNRLSPRNFLQRYLVNADRRDATQLEADIQAMLDRAMNGLVVETPAARMELPSSVATYDFKAVGDPMIVVYDQKGTWIDDHHYLGPAVVLFFNKHGRLDHIDFVGVCDRSGRNRQSPNSDYVGEHARLYVQSGLWRYRNGCGKQVAEISDRSWESEKQRHWRPSAAWLRPFTGQQTFVVHELQPKVIKGLPFDILWSMASAKELFSIDFDRAMAHEWVNSMLILAGTAQELSRLQKVSQELLSYAVMYGMAMTKSGSGVPTLELMYSMAMT